MDATEACRAEVQRISKLEESLASSPWKTNSFHTYENCRKTSRPEPTVPMQAREGLSRSRTNVDASSVGRLAEKDMNTCSNSMAVCAPYATEQSLKKPLLNVAASASGMGIPKAGGFDARELHGAGVLEKTHSPRFPGNRDLHPYFWVPSEQAPTSRQRRK